MVAVVYRIIIRNREFQITRELRGMDMPVFDFNEEQDNKFTAECTYTTFQSNESKPTADKPLLLLDNEKESGITIPVVNSPIRSGARHLNLRKKKEPSVQISCRSIPGL